MASKKTPMTQSAASRVQSTQAKAGADTGKGSFPARAQASAANNSKAPTVGGTPSSPTAKSAPTPKSPSGGKSKKK